MNLNPFYKDTDYELKEAKETIELVESSTRLVNEHKDLFAFLEDISIMMPTAWVSYINITNQSYSQEIRKWFWKIRSINISLPWQPVLVDRVTIIMQKAGWELAVKQPSDDSISRGFRFYHPLLVDVIDRYGDKPVPVVQVTLNMQATAKGGACKLEEYIETMEVTRYKLICQEDPINV